MNTTPLSSLSRDSYDKLNKMGLLFEIYPSATGDWEVDTNQNQSDVEKVVSKWTTAKERPNKTLTRFETHGKGKAKR